MIFLLIYVIPTLIPRMHRSIRRHESESRVLTKRISFLRRYLAHELRIAALQIVGPAALGGGVLGAEGALHALAWAPASPLLWYLNLEVFSPFRRVQGFLGANIGNVDFGLSIFGLMLWRARIGGYIFQRRLVLAIASNLSFMFATMLAVSLLFVECPSRVLAVTGEIFTHRNFHLFYSSGVVISVADGFSLYLSVRHPR